MPDPFGLRRATRQRESRTRTINWLTELSRDSSMISVVTRNWKTSEQKLFYDRFTTTSNTYHIQGLGPSAHSEHTPRESGPAIITTHTYSIGLFFTAFTTISSRMISAIRRNWESANRKVYDHVQVMPHHNMLMSCRCRGSMANTKTTVTFQEFCVIRGYLPCHIASYFPAHGWVITHGKRHRRDINIIVSNLCMASKHVPRKGNVPYSSTCGPNK